VLASCCHFMLAKTGSKWSKSYLPVKTILELRHEKIHICILSKFLYKLTQFWIIL